MMNILYGTNAGYCEQTAVSMRSVFVNNPGEDIHVYILCENVPPQLQRRMFSAAQGFDNVKITCVDPQPFVQPLLKQFHMKNWRGSSVQYIYAAICDVFPQLDRILWLDGDTVCCGSLTELYETDMDECCVAAGLDCTPFLAVSVDSVFYKTPYYFNAGVLLFDLKNCVKHELEQRCRSVLRRWGGKLQYCDQSMLNLALPPKLVKHFGLQWNYPAGVPRASMTCAVLRGTDEKPTFSADELDAALADLRIIHYIGGSLPTKPWFTEYNSPFKPDYLKYRAQTPWAEEPLKIWPRENFGKSFVTEFSKTWDTPAMAVLSQAFQRLHGLKNGTKNLPD